MMGRGLGGEQDDEFRASVRPRQSGTLKPLSRRQLPLSITQ